MAQGKPIDEQTRKQIEKLRDRGLSLRDTARAARVSTATVMRVQKKS